jgi:acetyl esterase
MRPAGSTNPLPGILYFHGGGWMLGHADTHDRLLRELVNATQATIVFVNYDRAPEAKFPIALEQAYSATAWVAENGTTIGVDTARLAVIGDGVGGNLATVVALLAKQRNGPTLCFQVLFYPVTDTELDSATYRQFGDGRYWLAEAGMQMCWDNYVAPDQCKNPLVAPLQASIEELRGMPPALIITAENDIMRSEGEAYVHKLIEAGVVVTATRYLGTIHDFVMLNEITNTPAARAAIAQASAALRNAFAR